MRIQAPALAAALVLATAAPAAAFGLDDIDFDKLGFDRSMEIMYGQGTAPVIGDFQAASIAGRQDLFWIFALRLAGLGNMTMASPSARAIGWGVRGDALITTGPLIPGIEAYAGMGMQLYNQPTTGGVTFATTQGYVFGVRALFLQLESRLDGVPGPGASLFGGLFFEY